MKNTYQEINSRSIVTAFVEHRLNGARRARDIWREKAREGHMEDEAQYNIVTGLSSGAICTARLIIFTKWPDIASGKPNPDRL